MHFSCFHTPRPSYNHTPQYKCTYSLFTEKENIKVMFHKVRRDQMSCEGRGDPHLLSSPWIDCLV